ncbi:MAG: DUF6273 domain-containing protein [Oscillospiraceae bacterium]|jgi:hypothetical protein|nr:DUF6273 domain-containing protein [Oscillospiraceae bacterium]
MGVEFSLEPLTPTPEAQGVDGALRALEYVFSKRGNRLYNIALTGGYGTGKSSVLETFRTKKVPKQKPQKKDATAEKKKQTETETAKKDAAAEKKKQTETETAKKDTKPEPHFLERFWAKINDLMKKRPCKKKFLYLSFTHFENDEIEKKEPPKQDKKPEEQLTTEDKEKQEQTATREEEARIEAKIINQLLHSVKPQKIPRTLFPIKRAWHIGHIGFAVALIASLLVVLKYRFDVVPEVVRDLYHSAFPALVLPDDRILAVAQAVLLLLAILAALYLIRLLIHLGPPSRLVLKKEPEMELSNNEINNGLTLFDKHLSEILYVLSKVSVDAIVIEDIDRASGNQLFVQLREICRLANIHRKKWQKPLRFIYLLKDEKFEALDRTKFFDLIIPVTPVLLSESKRMQLFSRLLIKYGVFAESEFYDKDGKLKEENALSWPYFLVKKSVYCIRDYRLLKNIVNEFLILKEEAQGAHGQGKGEESDKHPEKEKKAPAIPPPADTEPSTEEPPTKPSSDTASPHGKPAGLPDGKTKETPTESTEPQGDPDKTSKILALMIYKNLFPKDYEAYLHSHGMAYDYTHAQKPLPRDPDPKPGQKKSAYVETLRNYALLRFLLKHKLVAEDAKELAAKEKKSPSASEQASEKQDALLDVLATLRALKGQNLRDKEELVHLAGTQYRVLAVEKDKALLLQNQVTEHREYNAKYTSVTWETCSLRTYLNGAYLDHLPPILRDRIIPTTLENPNNTYGIWRNKPVNTPGGNQTEDKIFLLSLDELFKYLGVNQTILAQKETDEDGDFWWFSDEYDQNRTEKGNSGKSVWWWLRSPGFGPHYAARVDDDGYVDLYGYNVSRSSGGVRPALWLNLES